MAAEAGGLAQDLLWGVRKIAPPFYRVRKIAHGGPANLPCLQVLCSVQGYQTWWTWSLRSASVAGLSHALVFLTMSGPNAALSARPGT
jgi:hypothetical protein